MSLGLPSSGVARGFYSGSGMQTGGCTGACKDQVLKCAEASVMQASKDC